MDPITTAMALAQFAPQVIRWITGSDKAAEAAGKVVDIAEAVTGKGGIETVDALRADPTLVLQFRTSVLQVEADLDKAYLADRADARAREVALAQAGQRNTRADMMVRWAAIGTAGGFFAMVILGVLKARYPDGINEGVFGALLAQIATITSFFGLCLRDAYQYEFGSSRGSADKSALIEKLQR